MSWYSSSYSGKERNKYRYTRENSETYRYKENMKNFFMNNCQSANNVIEACFLLLFGSSITSQPMIFIDTEISNVLPICRSLFCKYCKTNAEINRERD